MNINVILIIAAVICFIIATILPENSGRLVSAGLALFAGSFLA